MAKPFNPFEHHHDHSDDIALNEKSDPGQESLADALRVSFLILKVVMLAFLVFYIFSGLKIVKEQEALVQLRFGDIVGRSSDQQVMRPRDKPYWTWPPPIEDVKTIATTVRSANLDQAFWYRKLERDAARKTEELARLGYLNPEEDSYLLTADANVLHMRWTISYRAGGEPQKQNFASNIVDYLRNVGDETLAEHLVHMVTEREIVKFAAQKTADQLFHGLSTADTARMEAGIQRSLDELDSGLAVMSVSATRPDPPGNLRGAFSAVSSAENERISIEQLARKAANTLLNDVAGSAHGLLWRLIQSYQVAYEAGDQQKADHLSRQLDHAFEKLNMGEEFGNVKIRGEVARIINNARSYRTRIRKETSAEVARFQSLLEVYNRSPGILVSQLWEQAMEQITKSAGVETLYTPNMANLVIGVNRDPEFRRKREIEDTKGQVN